MVIVQYHGINVFLNMDQIKSNLFIVTHHVHKCTDGEILRYKTVPWQYKQQDIYFKKKITIYINNNIHTLHNIQ